MQSEWIHWAQTGHRRAAMKLRRRSCPCRRQPVQPQLHVGMDRSLIRDFRDLLTVILSAGALDSCSDIEKVAKNLVGNLTVIDRKPFLVIEDGTPMSGARHDSGSLVRDRGRDLRQASCVALVTEI